jgi:hypothetical protein
MGCLMVWCVIYFDVGVTLYCSGAYFAHRGSIGRVLRIRWLYGGDGVEWGCGEGCRLWCYQAIF